MSLRPPFDPAGERVRGSPGRRHVAWGKRQGVGHDHQRLRPVQDRHRAVELAHGRADAGGGMFVAALAADGVSRGAALRVELFGSLGATGHGHGSVKAVVLGLAGAHPETVDPAAAEPLVAKVRETGARWPARTGHRDRLRPGRGHRPAPAQAAAVPLQRHDVHRDRRQGDRSPSAPTTRSAAGSCSARTNRGAPASCPTPRRCHTRSPAGRSCSPRPGQRAAGQRRDAGQRAGRAGPRRRSGPGCWQIWAGHAGVRAARLRGRRACCPAG